MVGFHSLENTSINDSVRPIPKSNVNLGNEIKAKQSLLF